MSKTLTMERRASLEWAIETAITCGYTSDADVLRGLLADILATQQPEPRDAVTDDWIRVDEKLPPYNRKIGTHGVEVLIWPAMESGERTAFFGRRISQKPMFYRYGAPVHGVTHWMPIPDAPADAARAGEG
ncbi:DUF551 domain-containing protein [Burkholderia sp. AU45274]|uniref:DUF551 domain-containing protein n=1 Tax=Burkholderia sp. AU45274 TaxID=3059205 RepID=UPI0026552DD4|nr:DUF551 domain-containing protein [Burkholderia sp. AU45274]MDN7489457.1 DUF551 domain-containing protein [Burkholderia sp. AU45274]